MEREVILGNADVGFGWEKFLVGGKVWRQPSIIGEARTLFEENVRSEDIQYIKDDRHYFVGDLALRHSQVKYAGTAEDKTKLWTTKVFLETGLGILAPRSNIYLITGLPVDYYFKQKASFEKLLQEFNEPEPYEIQVGNSKHVARPWIKEYRVTLQPMGAAMNFILDKDGKIARHEEAKNCILVIDLGYYTLNLLSLECMEIGKCSGSPEGLGVDTAYKLIQDALKDKLGKAPNRYELDQYVRAGKYNGYDIRPIIAKAFEALGKQINMEIQSLNTIYSHYIITGGWASTIADFLDIDKTRTTIYDQLGNVTGYSKLGRRLWPNVQ